MTMLQLCVSKRRTLSLYCTNINQYPAVDANSQAEPVDSMSVDNHGPWHHSLKHVILYFTTHVFHNHSRQSSDRIIHLFHEISDCHLLPCCLSYPTIILLTSCRVVTVRPFGAPLQASVMRIVRLGSDTMEPGFYPHHQKIIILNLSYRKPLNPCKITMCC